MVVRARSVAAVLSGIAAFPLAAHASFSFGMPSFSCSTDGGVVAGINWGDKSSMGSPMISTDLTISGNLPAVQFGCSNKVYSAGVEGKEFQVNFGMFQPPDPLIKFDGVSLANDYKEIKFFNADGLPQMKWDTFYDLWLNVDKWNGDGWVFDHKDFIGIKLDSGVGFASPGSFVVVDGSVFLDPSIPGGSAVVSLYNTPEVPEPATLLLFGTGAAAGVLRRKRKSKA